jgi:glycosyltransferase involved in cell wall biosynthesis
MSVVVPVLNEAANVPELTRALTAVLDALGSQEGLAADAWEVVFVDDGSTDTTWTLIEERHRADARIGGLRLSRRFGHHLAVTAGLDRAAGAAVVVMDGDLQDPPEEIPALYARYRAGFDLVYGVRRSRRDPLMKRINSRLFWWTLNRLSGLDMPPDQMMLRVMSRRFVDAVGQMRESARFIHGMMAWAGFRVTTVEVEHHARRAGRTNYSLLRQIRLALHAVTAFSTAPLRLATTLGTAAIGGSVAAAIGLLVGRVGYGRGVPAWAAVVDATLFLTGVQLMVLGVIGEYLGRVYGEVQRRPLYFVSEAL